MGPHVCRPIPCPPADVRLRLWRRLSLSAAACARRLRRSARCGCCCGCCGCCGAAAALLCKGVVGGVLLMQGRRQLEEEISQIQCELLEEMGYGAASPAAGSSRPFSDFVLC